MRSAIQAGALLRKTSFRTHDSQKTKISTKSQLKWKLMNKISNWVYCNCVISGGFGIAFFHYLHQMSVVVARGVTQVLLVRRLHLRILGDVANRADHNSEDDMGNAPPDSLGHLRSPSRFPPKNCHKPSQFAWNSFGFLKVGECPIIPPSFLLFVAMIRKCHLRNSQPQKRNHRNIGGPHHAAVPALSIVLPPICTGGLLYPTICWVAFFVS